MGTEKRKRSPSPPRWEGINPGADPTIDWPWVAPRIVGQTVADGECWRWIGRTVDGYGVLALPAGSYAQSGQKVHRLMYRYMVGPIPEGRQLHHRCHTRACVNPSHLEVVTPAEHGLEHHAEECAKGHRLEGENVLVKPDGRRRCRVCTYERDKGYRRAKSRFHRGDHKTQCVRGHPWIPENIRVNAKGHRSCRLCAKESRSARTERDRAVREHAKATV